MEGATYVGAEGAGVDGQHEAARNTTAAAMRAIFIGGVWGLVCDAGWLTGRFRR